MPQNVTTPRSLKPSFAIGSQLLEVLLRGWKLGLLCGVLGVGISILVMALVEPKWDAKATVGPVVPDARFGLSQGISLSSGLSLLGQATGPEGQRLERFLITLQSRILAERLEKKHHVLRMIFYRHWDGQRNTWKKELSAGGILRVLAGLPVSETPTIDDLQTYLKDHIAVSLAAPQLPNRKIVFGFRDRQVALNVLQWSLAEADAIIREETESNVDKQIAQLDFDLEHDTVSSVEIRNSLTQLLSESEKSKLLLVGGQPYAVEIIDPVSAPILPDFPSPKIFVTTGAVAGVLAGFGLAWLNISFNLFGRLAKRKSAIPQSTVGSPARHAVR